MSNLKPVKNKIVVNFSFESINPEVFQLIVDMENKLIQKVLQCYFGEFWKTYDKKYVIESSSSFNLVVDRIDIGVISHIFNGKSYKVEFVPKELDYILEQTRALMAKDIDDKIMLMNEKMFEALTAPIPTSPLGIFHYLKDK